MEKKKISLPPRPDCGSIEINYAIEIEHAVAGQNLFQIQVREKPPVLRQ